MYNSHWIFLPVAKWPKKNKKKKQWDLVPQRPIKRERKDPYLHGNPKVTSVPMAPLSTYHNLILQSIICLCEKPNFTKKKLVSDYYCISNDKKKLKT